MFECIIAICYLPWRRWELTSLLTHLFSWGLFSPDEAWSRFSRSSSWEKLGLSQSTQGPQDPHPYSCYRQLFHQLSHSSSGFRFSFGLWSPRHLYRVQLFGRSFFLLSAALSQCAKVIDCALSPRWDTESPIWANHPNLLTSPRYFKKILRIQNSYPEHFS